MFARTAHRHTATAINSSLSVRLRYSSPTFGCISFSSGDTNTNVFYLGGSRRRSASLRRADAAQVCSHVGFVAVDGALKRSFTITARQIVSERWREGGGPKHLSLAATSAFHSTRRRQISRWPLRADQCSGVQSLKKSKRINLRKQSFAS